jgi:hypothetical protein
MSPLIKGLTFVVWLIPLVFGILTLVLHEWLMGVVFLFLIALYGAVWLGCRPSHFVVSHNRLEIVFPVWQRKIPIQTINGIRILNPDGFRQEFGWAMRIGVGGLWGGFGWLWTSRQGMLEFYISRTDSFILIERSRGNSLLITPEQPTQFIETVRAMLVT